MKYKHLNVEKKMMEEQKHCNDKFLFFWKMEEQIKQRNITNNFETKYMADRDGAVKMIFLRAPIDKNGKKKF